jgi:guanine nucleotide-binding protein G(i) subunit alpha
MGGCVSTVDQAGKVRFEEIDKLIKDDSEHYKRDCKILLLGTPLLFLSLQFVNVDYHRLG